MSRSTTGRRPKTCTTFECEWKRQNWSEELRPDRCGAVFHREPDIRTIYGGTRQVFIADLDDPYANLRPVLSRHLKCLYDGGHVTLVAYSAVNSNDSWAAWRFRPSLYPSLTDERLMKQFRRSHAAEFAQQRRFYAGRR